jgi:hypothetical protein
VVLANVCRDADASGGCVTGALVALDLATGDLRWELPGFRALGTFGDGSAIVGDEFVAGGESPSFVMIDLDTGAAVPGQEWAPGTFVNGCCGEGDFVHVGRDGGVVWAVDYRTIRVYYPEALATPTVVVDLGA